MREPAERRTYRLGILQDPNSRGGSVAAHAHLREGTEVRIGVPRNHFPLSMDASRSMLVGGGIGVTPMIAMAHALADVGKDFELHYCGRSRSASAFIDELNASSFSDRVHLHFDDEEAAQKARSGPGPGNPRHPAPICTPAARPASWTG